MVDPSQMHGAAHKLAQSRYDTTMKAALLTDRYEIAMLQAYFSHE
jgi:nicotinic acid phosphoribosyltransferase